MDFPRILADWIEKWTGIKSEADPSPADMRGFHFVVSVASFFLEPNGETSRHFLERMAFVENGGAVESYRMALPVKVVFKSQGSGEQWRGSYLEQAQKNARLFHESFRLPISGGRLVGEAAIRCNDGVPEDIANFEENNTDDLHGLGFIVGLERAPGLDVVFQRIDGSNRGYNAEQAFTGEIVFIDGMIAIE